MAAIITSDSLSILSSAVIADRRELLRRFFDYEAKRNPLAPFPHPKDLLLNILALQGSDERVWRERQSRRYARRLAWHHKRRYHPRLALLLVLGETIDQIDAMPIKVVIVEQMLRGALRIIVDLIESEQYDEDDDDRVRFGVYSEFCFDLIRYGAADHPNREYDLVRAFCERIRQGQIPVHPVRNLHPRGIVIA